MNNTKKFLIAFFSILIIAIVIASRISMFSSQSVDSNRDYAQSQQQSAYVAVSDRTSTPKPNITTSRKVIKTANLSITVQSLEQSIKILYQAVQRFEGMVANQAINNSTSTSYSSSYSTITVWVPSEKLLTFVEAMNDLGKVTNSTINSEDITDTFVDTEARMLALKTQEKRMLQLLAKENNELDQVLRVVNELARLRTDIESIEGSIRQWDRQVASSSVTVTLTQPVAIAAPTEEPLEVFKPFYALFTKMTDAFLLSFSKNLGFIAFLVSAIAYLMPWLVTALLTLLLWRLGLRKVTYTVYNYLKAK